MLGFGGKVELHVQEGDGLEMMGVGILFLKMPGNLPLRQNERYDGNVNSHGGF